MYFPYKEMIILQIGSRFTASNVAYFHLATLLLLLASVSAAVGSNNNFL